MLSAGLIQIPIRLVVAFCDYSKTSRSVSGQLRIKSVFRVYGATTYGDISQPITPVSTLTTLLPLPLIYTANSWFTFVPSVSSISLNTVSIVPEGTTDTSFVPSVQTTTNHNLVYNTINSGAGITISSLYFDLF